MQTNIEQILAEAQSIVNHAVALGTTHTTALEEVARLHTDNDQLRTMIDETTTKYDQLMGLYQGGMTENARLESVNTGFRQVIQGLESEITRLHLVIQGQARDLEESQRVLDELQNSPARPPVTTASRQYWPDPAAAGVPVALAPQPTTTVVNSNSSGHAPGNGQMPVQLHIPITNGQVAGNGHMPLHSAALPASPPTNTVQIAPVADNWPTSLNQITDPVLYKAACDKYLEMAKKNKKVTVKEVYDMVQQQAAGQPMVQPTGRIRSFVNNRYSEPPQRS